MYRNYLNWDVFEEIGNDIRDGYQSGIIKVKETADKLSDFCDSHCPWSQHPHSNSTITLVG